MHTAERTQRNRKPYFTAGALILASICYLLWSVSGTLYNYMDNMTVSLVSAGMYGSSFFCQYIHPLFSIIVHGLSGILVQADVFALLVHAFLFLGVFFLFYMALDTAFRKSVTEWEVKDFLEALAMLLGILVFCMGINIWSVNYTVQTSALLLCAIVTLSYGLHREKGKAWIAAGTILAAAGFLMRTESVLLFLPFMALSFFVSLLTAKEKKEYLRKSLRFLGPAVLAGVVLLASSAVFNAREPYASDNRYNRYRTTAEDYPVKAYRASGAEKEGITEDEYMLVSSEWMLLDTARFDTELMRKVADSGSMNAYPSTAAGLAAAVREMARTVSHTDIFLFVLAILAVLLAVRNISASGSGLLKAESILALAGGFVILLYFTVRGRALFRVWQSVLLAQISVLLCSLLHIAREKKERKTADPASVPARHNGRKKPLIPLLLTGIIAIGLFYCTGQVTAHTVFHEPVSPLFSRSGADESMFSETKEGDGLYIWYNWYFTAMQTFADQEKLPSEEFLQHNIPAGDWVYGQVYFREHLEKLDAENPAEALFARPDTRLVGGATESFMRYMRKNYGEDLVFEEAGTVNGETVYRVERSGLDD